MTPAAPAPTDLKTTLEEMRASVAAQGTQKGLAALVQDAVLKILEMLMGLLADFRAGRLAAPPGAPVTPDEGAPAAALPRATKEKANGAGWWRAFAGMTAKAVAFPEMAGNIEASAQPGAGSLDGNGEMRVGAGDAARLPLATTSPRRRRANASTPRERKEAPRAIARVALRHRPCGMNRAANHEEIVRVMAEGTRRSPRFSPLHSANSKNRLLAGAVPHAQIVTISKR